MAEYHVENFGCRASRADGEIISAELRQRGMTQASSAASADVVVANTCSVTAQADRTARAFLRRLQRVNPTAQILVTGCYAQRAPQEVAALPGVHAVIGNSHKSLVAALASDHLGEAQPNFVGLGAIQKAAIYADDTFAHAELAMPPEAWGRQQAASHQTRPNLKVQDGCGNRCSFCVIPATRGHSRSLPLEKCIESVRNFVAAGGKELVLSGINLGRWGKDLLPQRSLEELVAAILSETSLARLRLSSIEPMDWSPALLSLFRADAAGRLARHAHLPLQSGSDAILRAMHRRYRPWHYAEKLRAIRDVMPDAAIGADVMVGFPGESDALFEESFHFIASLPFTYLHLFPFSARPGTHAWELNKAYPVSPPAVQARMERLRALIDERTNAFHRSFIGRCLPAITLYSGSDGAEQAFTRAITDNFIEVRLDCVLPANTSIRVHVNSVAGSGVTASLSAPTLA